MLLLLLLLSLVVFIATSQPISIPGETIPWPGYIPPQYLVTLQIKNSTACKSSYTTVQPLGTILYAETGLYGNPSQNDDDYHGYGDDDDYTIQDQNFLPGGVCFPLGNNNNKGSIIYYYVPTCILKIGTLNVTSYNCKYQFYDSNSQTCANVNTGTQVFGSLGTCFVDYHSNDVIFTTIEAYPIVLWANEKGITTQIYNSNKCSANNILAYSFQSSSCIYEGGYSDDNDDAGFSTNEFCTSEGIVLDKYYGSGCKSKSLLFEKIRERNSFIANEESNVYSCALFSKKNNITVSNTVGSFNIGSFYQSVDCKHKYVVSLTTAICLTFFIPLIFYILCWVIIVKVMKRGDLCAKALCLEGNKKKVDLASQDGLTLNQL